MATCESEVLKNGNSKLRYTVKYDLHTEFQSLGTKKNVANISNFLCYFDFEKLIH